MGARIFRMAWPILLSYVAVGVACGVLEAQAGMEPWMGFVLGATFLTGSGQFMMSNLWMAGVPIPSILVSLAAVSSRFALYSASLAPYLTDAGHKEALAVCSTLTEEGYGLSLSQFAKGGDWTARHAFLLNLMGLVTWAVSCAVGIVLGSAVDIPTAIAGFACTSLFICLLATQRLTRGTAVAAGAAAIAVLVCKCAGASGVAVPVGAVVGVVCALISDALRPGEVIGHASR